MVDVNCKGCGKKLMVASLLNGAIKCPRCKMIFEYKIFNNMYVTNEYDPTHLHIKK